MEGGRERWEMGVMYLCRVCKKSLGGCGCGCVWEGRCVMAG